MILECNISCHHYISIVQGSFHTVILHPLDASTFQLWLYGSLVHVNTSLKWVIPLTWCLICTSKIWYKQNYAVFPLDTNPMFVQWITFVLVLNYFHVSNETAVIVCVPLHAHCHCLSILPLTVCCSHDSLGPVMRFKELSPYGKIKGASIDSRKYFLL